MANRYVPEIRDGKDNVGYATIEMNTPTSIGMMDFQSGKGQVVAINHWIINAEEYKV